VTYCEHSNAPAEYALEERKDVGKVRSAIALAYPADEGCYSLYVSGHGETPPITKCITEFGNDHCSENFMKSRWGHDMGNQDSVNEHECVG